MFFWGDLLSRGSLFQGDTSNQRTKLTPTAAGWRESAVFLCLSISMHVALSQFLMEANLLCARACVVLILRILLFSLRQKDPDEEGLPCVKRVRSEHFIEFARSKQLIRLKYLVCSFRGKKIRSP